MYRRLFWDLDGTISDPREGIAGALTYALTTMGITPDPGTLDRFIGPPLRSSLTRYYGLEGDRLEETVAHYRERFAAVGWRQNRLYPGMRDLLLRLRAAGLPMAVATAKPAPFAARIVALFEIDACFDAVFAATLDGRVGHKRDVLHEAVRGLAPGERSQCAMIGDHADDVEAAHAEGLVAIAVTYGYGLRDDLVRARPDRMEPDVAALARHLLSGPDLEERAYTDKNMQ